MSKATPDTHSATRYAVGDIAHFQPDVTKIDASTNKSDDSALPVKVMGVKFVEGKVLYDVAVPNGDGTFYVECPLREVDSFLLVDIA